MTLNNAPTSLAKSRYFILPSVVFMLPATFAVQEECILNVYGPIRTGVILIQGATQCLWLLIKLPA